MPNRRRTRVLIVAGGLVVVLGGFLLWARKEYGGLRNLFSAAFWQERASASDLFDKSKSIFKRGSRQYPHLLLTIDDGPHPASLPKILDTLKQYHVHATFFLVGKMVKLHPELARRIIEEGHEIGNHTQDHLRLDTLTEKQVRAELTDCDINISNATGHVTKLMRPPGMRFNAAVLKVVKEMGYICVDWNLAAKDFVPAVDKKEVITPAERESMKLDPRTIAERIVDRIKNGEIILLHDIPATADALPTILAELQEKGYEFKSTAEMLDELPQHVAIVSNPLSTIRQYTASKALQPSNPLKPKLPGGKSR